MPINILYMIDNIHYGGTECQLVELIRHLDRSRFRPHLCTLKPSNSLYDELDIPKFCLDFSSFSHPTLFTKLSKLVQFIRTHDIHIVQTFFQDPFLLAAMAKPFHKVKLVGSFRDLGFWRTPSISRKMRMAYPFFSGFIANSQAVKEYFANIDGISLGKIEVIYNGIDCQLLDVHSTRANHGNGKQLVGIVANMNRKVKRVEDFVKAAALVHRQEPAARFIIVGDGEFRDGLETLASQLGMRDFITFTGRVANPMQYVKDFRVGVITSETEGFCNAIVEYMACGVPVVATRVGGNPELITEGENGFLVPMGDPEELAKKIVHLLKDESLQSKIGDSNREKIIREYSLSVVLERQSRYYDKLLARR